MNPPPPAPLIFADIPPFSIAYTSSQRELMSEGWWLTSRNVFPWARSSMNSFCMAAVDVLSNPQCRTLLWHNCLSQIRCQFGYRPIGLNQNMQHSPFFVIGIVWGHKSRTYRASSFLHRSLSEGSDCFWQSYQPHYKRPISFVHPFRLMRGYSLDKPDQSIQIRLAVSPMLYLRHGSN